MVLGEFDRWQIERLGFKTSIHITGKSELMGWMPPSPGIV